MILTGKSKEDFLYWNHYIKDNDHGFIDIEPTSLSIGFRELDESLQYTLIIEWFDSVGIYIVPTPVFPIEIYGWSYSINLDITGSMFFNNRQEATEKAIIKANLIYNENKTIKKD